MFVLIPHRIVAEPATRRGMLRKFGKCVRFDGSRAVCVFDALSSYHMLIIVTVNDISNQIYKIHAMHKGNTKI